MDGPLVGGAAGQGLLRDKRRSLLVAFMGMVALALVALYFVSSYQTQPPQDAFQVRNST